MNLNTSDKEIEINQLNILSLAHLGDAVYELMVRDYVIHKYGLKPGKLHEITIKFVCAAAQAEGFDKIFDTLSEKEQQVIKRGRNNSTAKVPKNASSCDYRKATGLECLFGYLYLKGENSRIEELFKQIIM